MQPFGASVQMCSSALRMLLPLDDHQEGSKQMSSDPEGMSIEPCTRGTSGTKGSDVTFHWDSLQSLRLGTDTVALRNNQISGILAYP